MTAGVKQRYCAYCRVTRDDVGFKTVFHPASGTSRAQCSPCQEMRKRPREELDQRAKQDAAARAAANSEFQKSLAAERRKKLP